MNYKQHRTIVHTKGYSSIIQEASGSPWIILVQNKGPLSWRDESNQKKVDVHMNTVLQLQFKRQLKLAYFVAHSNPNPQGLSCVWVGGGSNVGVLPATTNRAAVFKRLGKHLHFLIEYIMMMPWEVDHWMLSFPCLAKFHAQQIFGKITEALSHDHPDK